MTSSMLAGERRWASARRGGMTVSGKVAVPKPLNLPSQKLENHGLDPNVEIVPKGSLSWGNRPSSSTSNPWGSSAISPKADGTTGLPSLSCGRPSSGRGLSRPSTAGSDRTHEPAASAWVPNSRPSSASGVLTSNQPSLTSRPQSAETRPGSSHLSRFAEPVSDNSIAWGPNGTAEKLLMPSKNNEFSLSSGDFPTLGSEKDNAGKGSESHDHDSHVRPSSASGRTAPANERNAISQADIKSATVNTWTRDGPLHVEDGVRPSAEKWQGAQQQYVNPNVHPQHFDAWGGPPMNAPAGVWYRGPPGGPPYPPVAHGGYPVEPFPYYRPQISPALANSQPCPPAGVGPRGHHPKKGDFYRPQMPDPFICPGMPIRPGFYPGPVPYDGYYGPPMGYSPNEHNIPFMGMPPGPPVYNMYPAQNLSEPSDGHFRDGGCGSTGNMLVPEQLDSVRPEESRGPYKVCRKHENEWDAHTEDNWGPTTVANSLSLEKGDQPRPSSRKNERGADNRRNEDMPSRRNTTVENPFSRNFGNRGNSSDSVIVHSHEGMYKSKALDDSWAKKSETGATSFPEVPHIPPAEPKDSCLIQKVEGLGPKVQASDVRKDTASGFLREVQKDRLLVNPKANNSTVELVSTYTGGDLALTSHDMGVATGDITIKSTITSAPHSRRSHYGVQSRADHLSKGRLNNQDADWWRKNPLILVSESAAAVSNQNVCHTTTSQVSDNHISMEAVEKSESKDVGESSSPMFDSTDGQAQRAKMRELAKQRAIQLQEEEEERIREQKAKALAKLEELNRRTLAAADGTIQNVEKTATSGPVQQDVHGSQALPGPVIAASKHEALCSGLSANTQATAQTMESSTSVAGQSTALSRDSHLEMPKNDQQEPVVSHSQLLPSKQNVANTIDDESKAAPLINDGSLPRQKRVGHKQKQSVQVGKSLAYKSTLIGSSETLKGHAGAVIQHSGTNVAVSGEAVPSVDPSLYNNLNRQPESTTHQRKKTNRSSKSKHMHDDASTTATALSSSVSRESDLAKVSTESGKQKSPEFKLDTNVALVIDSEDGVQPNLEQNALPSEEAHGRENNQYKPQHSHRVPRNPQANTSVDRFHGGDAVMWAPVQAQNKAEPGDEAGHTTVQDGVPPPPKNSNSFRTSVRSKRAEMERYTPKPVDKELAQQGSIQQPAAPCSRGKSTLEEPTEREVLGSQSAIPASGNVGPAVESKDGDSKHNKQVKSHGAWHQRGPNELYRGQDLHQGSSSTPNSSKNYDKSMGQHESSNPVPTVTNIIHEWDPSDGWHIPEYPPTEVSAVASVVKDQGGITGKGKRQTYKGQRSSVNNHDIYHKTVSSAEVNKNQMQSMSLEINQTNRPVSSKEHRSSHWQPKSQSHRGDTSSGGQNASSEVMKDSPQVQPEESAAEDNNAREVPHIGHHDSSRGRRSASSKGRPHSPNQGFGNMEDDAPEHLHVSLGFRKNRGQNNRSAGQDNRQRQNSHYKYQPVGSNNNNNSKISKFNNLDAPIEGSQSTAPRYKETGSGQSRGGGDNFHW